MKLICKCVWNNSWSVANVCCSVNLDILQLDHIVQLLILALNYSSSTKEKVLSSSTRALGYIISKCSLGNKLPDVIQWINENQDLISGCSQLSKLKFIKDNQLTVNNIVGILVEKLHNTSPKIVWNVWVSISNILEQQNIRSLDCSILFSEEWVSILIYLAKSSTNYKVRIHATQTLTKYNTWTEYLGNFIEVFHLSISLLKDLWEHRDQTVFKYIDTLQESSLNLLIHLLSWAENDDAWTTELAKYINDNIEYIKNAPLQYLRNKFSAASFSSSQSSVEDNDENFLIDSQATNTTSQALKNDPTLRNICFKVKQFFINLKDYIYNCESIRVKFSIFESIVTIADTPIDEFANI